MSYIFAVDIGGTFTDLVACNLDTGAVTYSKSATTYGNFGDGIFDCIKKASVAPRDALFVKHGTTLVINSLLQRTGARTALATTRGFRDVLEIGRGNRTQPFNLRFRRDEALIPRERRFEVTERMGADGAVRTPIDEEDLERLAGRLRAEKIDALAISFLNAYANSSHEDEAAARLKQLLPGVFISTGSSLSREWHEFERTATAAANAYVGPQTSDYIAEFDRHLREAGFKGSLLMMGSHGGVLSTERVRREPIALVESGPVGGCIGAAAYAVSLKLGNVIAFDMGGTTAKCALVEEGRFAVESTYHVGGFDTGFPIRGNVIDIIEVGAGGGSVAWLDEQGRLQVGPRSAGSTPGPACYGRGGTEPTVTDANLVLGRLDPTHFLGGEMQLDGVKALDAIRRHVAQPLGYEGEAGVVRAAQGILTIADLTMADAIKRISIARGRDPRDFALFCYGGGGPLHGVQLARELHIPRVIVPPEPGNFSAVGMLLADARLDTARTYLANFDQSAMDEALRRFEVLENESRIALEKEFGPRPVAFGRQVEMRYKGQKHSLKVELPGEGGMVALHEVFNREYQRRYGHSNARAKMEMVALHSTAMLEIRRPELARLAVKTNLKGTPAKRVRQVYFGDEGEHLATRIYNRYSLPAGFKATGPAIIEEYGSSTLVGPRDRFEIGALGEIRIECSA
ncbi:MAG: hydantoinase/oxoprolinase family protein [Betaproteobacteria bacterium]|nr:hydantoinase/oxoprolinase family protein [Betaproteobacteria bacterium]